MPAPIPTPVSAVCSAVKSRLAAKLGLPSHLIRWVARGQPPRFQGDRDILLRLSPPSPRGESIDSKGRTCTLVQRVLSVTIRTRLGVDASDSDESWLLDPSYGQLPYEDLVTDALHGWAPADASDNWLTQEVMRLVPSEELARPVAAQNLVDVQLGESGLHFEILYQLSLDQAWVA